MTYKLSPLTSVVMDRYYYLKGNIIQESFMMGVEEWGMVNETGKQGVNV